MKMPRLKTPALKVLAHQLACIKRRIGDDDRASCDDTVPSVSVTIGWSAETGEWDYQTGDNSFAGAAYSYPIWAVTELDRGSNCLASAKYLVEQLAEQAADSHAASEGQM